MASAVTTHRSTASILALLCITTLAVFGQAVLAQSARLNASHAQSVEPGWHESVLLHDDLERTFRFYVPEKLAAEVPVVVLLHGGTGSTAELFDRKGRGTQEWRQIAEQEGILLLVPNGTDPRTGAPTGDKLNWNDCRPETGSKFSEADDVGFVAALLDWTTEHFFERNISIDTDRVYVTGSSNGGLMAYRLATELPDRFAGAAVFIANRPANSECVQAATPVPMLIVNGTEDPLMPFEGGEIGMHRGEVMAAEATRDYWIRVNHARARGHAVTRVPNHDAGDGSVVLCETYSATTPQAAPVEFCRVDGGGHSMPSREHQLSRIAQHFVGPQNHDIEGARLAWKFFEQYGTQAEH